MPPSGDSTSRGMDLHIGILEVQGAYLEHRVALQKANDKLDTNSRLVIHEVRTPEHITDTLDGLVIPGGESTAISLFLKRNKMVEPLRDWVKDEHHVTWGTCAGMILLAKMTENQKIGGQPTLDIMDVDVSRNFFGRQVQSFEADISIKDRQLSNLIPSKTFHGVFIRAPAVIKTLKPEVEILGTLSRPDVKDDVIVAAKQGNVFSTAFHPELTDDCSWHMFFLQMVYQVKQQKR